MEYVADATRKEYKMKKILQKMFKRHGMTKVLIVVTSIVWIAVLITAVIK
jgi:hypothetical protein